MTLYFKNDLILVEVKSGIGKESGKPWARVELHDPATLKNIGFTLDGNQKPENLVARNSYRVVIDVEPGATGNFYKATLLAPELKQKTA
ncbi:MAG: hypothetical protein FWE90_08295 [Defluviitaleaceae bacterium]|nr:hypothetical protein [Defluviitaleaceae bacterium]